MTGDDMDTKLFHAAGFDLTLTPMSDADLHFHAIDVGHVGTLTFLISFHH